MTVEEAKAAQSGHGGWASDMEKAMGMTGVVESIDKDGDVRVKMDDGGSSYLWNASMVLPGVVMSTASLQVVGAGRSLWQASMPSDSGCRIRGGFAALAGRAL